MQKFETHTIYLFVSIVSFSIYSRNMQTILIWRLAWVKGVHRLVYLDVVPSCRLYVWSFHEK